MPRHHGVPVVQALARAGGRVVVHVPQLYLRRPPAQRGGHAGHQHKAKLVFGRLPAGQGLNGDGRGVRRVCLKRGHVKIIFLRALQLRARRRGDGEGNIHAVAVAQHALQRNRGVLHRLRQAQALAQLAQKGQFLLLKAQKGRKVCAPGKGARRPGRQHAAGQRRRQQQGGHALSAAGTAPRCARLRRGAAACLRGCGGQQPPKLRRLLRLAQRHGGIFLRAHGGPVQRVVFVFHFSPLLSRRRASRCRARATRVFTAPTLMPRAAASSAGVLP